MMWGLKRGGTEADSPILKFSVRTDVTQNQYIQKEWRRGKSHEYCLWTFVHVKFLWNIQVEMSEFWDLILRRGLGSENTAEELAVCSWGYLKPKGSNFSVNYEAELFACGLGSVWHLLLFSHSVVSDSLRPHGMQHSRLPCRSPSPQIHIHWVDEAIQPSEAPI